MLFETEKKAENFIKFNSENIEEETGHKPERSYYCIACNGWHITSWKEYSHIKSKTEEILDYYQQEKEKKTLTRENLTLVRTEKRKELREILDVIEKYISILECSEKDTNCYMETLYKAFGELEKIKDIGVAFKGSKKRKKEAVKKLNILRNEIKKL